MVKKYLDIQAGPSGISSNARQKQASRPSSRANNKVTEAAQRPAGSTLLKPPTRPTTDDSAHSTKQRQPVRGPPTPVDVRVPRQRTMSQMQRDPPPRNLHLNTQSSSAAQRCIVPTFAPARQAVQQPAPGVARVLPPRNTPSTGGPQRPPPPQMKFNPPPDRLKVTGNGAKRIPLPSVPVIGQSGEQVVAPTKLTDRAGGAVDDPRSKLPSRMLAASRKAPEGPRSASSSTKPANGSASTVSAVVNRSNKPSVKDKMSKPSGVAPERRPAGNVQTGTRPLVKAERKETSPTLIPLPPSPSTLPTDIPLPSSPASISHPTDDAQNEPVIASPSGSTNSVGKQLGSAEPCQKQGDTDPPSTPITTLLSSIQRGFLFTPSSPLSPPQNYLPVPGNLPGKRQDAIAMNFNDPTKDPLPGVLFCVSLNDGVVDDLDRHALRDLN